VAYEQFNKLTTMKRKVSNSVIRELPSSNMCYINMHNETRTRSERFRRRYLYLAALITAQLEAMSVGVFRNTLLSLDAGLCLLSLSTLVLSQFWPKPKVVLWGNFHIRPKPKLCRKWKVTFDRNRKSTCSLLGDLTDCCWHVKWRTVRL